MSFVLLLPLSFPYGYSFAQFFNNCFLRHFLCDRIIIKVASFRKHSHINGSLIIRNSSSNLLYKYFDTTLQFWWFVFLVIIAVLLLFVFVSGIDILEYQSNP